MAESNQDGANGGSWWGSLLSAAKQQTENLLETVSHDLAEFTCTMHSDTKKVVDKTKESLQRRVEDGEEGSATDRVRQGFHCLMEGITKALYIDPDDGPPTKTGVIEPSHTTLFDRSQARLRAIQVDTGTYLNEPSGPPELFADWLKSFDIENHKGQVSDLLVSMVEVRSLYTTLVPSEVSHHDFWRRYFYKVHQLELDEARKQALMKRAERADTKEDSIGWDEDDSDDDRGSPIKTSPKTSPGASDRLKPVLPASPTELKPTKSQDIEAELKSTLAQQSIDKSATYEKQSDTNSETKSVEKIEPLTEDTESISSGGQAVVVETKVPEVNSTEAVLEKVETKLEEKTKVSSDEVKEDAKSSNELVTMTKEVAKETCDEVTKEGEIKTKVKGDMVVVGDQASSSSDSSCNKDSAVDDWEEDFADVDVTQEDLEAATKLAQKLDLSAKDYNTLVGEDDEENTREDDWENWS